MDGTGSSISPHDLCARLGTAQAPILIDVRKPADFAASDCCIVAAFRRAPSRRGVSSAVLIGQVGRTGRGTAPVVFGVFAVPPSARSHASASFV